jgi:hypothetical protein
VLINKGTSFLGKGNYVTWVINKISPSTNFVFFERGKFGGLAIKGVKSSIHFVNLLHAGCANLYNPGRAILGKDQFYKICTWSVFPVSTVYFLYWY